jgi:hypothetical protein
MSPSLSLLPNVKVVAICILELPFSQITQKKVVWLKCKCYMLLLCSMQGIIE